MRSKFHICTRISTCVLIGTFRVNLVLHDFVMAHTSSVVPPPPQHVISPFEAGLVKAGWSKDDSDDED